MEDRQEEERDYERFLLGCIIYGNAKERMLDVLQVIPADASYFTNPRYRAVYQILASLSINDQLSNDASLITDEIWNTLQSHPKDYDCSFKDKNEFGMFVFSLGNQEVPGMQMDAYKDYAERVKWAHDRNAYERVGLEIANEAKSTPFGEREDFISRTETKVNNLSLEVRNSDGLRQVGETTSGIRGRLQLIEQWLPIDVGLQTGIDALDRILGGFNRGELCILAAGTAYGKSMLASSIALNIVTRKDPRSVMLFSLEMMDDQLTTRAIANLARVNTRSFDTTYTNIVNGYYRRHYRDDIYEQKQRKLIETQLARYKKAMTYYDGLPLYTDTTPALNANEIKSMVLQKQREIEHDDDMPPLGLIIVDYLQIMTPVDARNTNRTDEVGDISRRLKRLAKETGIPVLCLAQLNRQAQDGEQPSLSMLRESGSIEQDADKVMFLWGENKGKRPKDYTDMPPNDDFEVAQKLAWRRDQMRLKLTVAKNRQGEQGTCDIIGDYAFQSVCSQSSADIDRGQPFDDFFNEYYEKTRSGTDLFFPMSDDDLPIPEFKACRHLESQEQVYLDKDNIVIRAQAPRIERTSNQPQVTPSMATTYAPSNAKGPQFPFRQEDLAQDAQVNILDDDEAPIDWDSLEEFDG